MDHTNCWDCRNALDDQKHGSPLRMMNNTGQKVFFIHINKTAGTSMGMAIGIRYEGGPHLVFHMSAYQMMLVYGKEVFDSTLKFTVVRNPYTRLLSMYRFRIRTKQTGFDGKIPSLSRFFYEGIVGKSARYRWGSRGGQMGEELMFMNQYDWLCHPLDRNQVLVDRVLRFENLQEDFNALSRELGQPEVVLPRLQSSASPHDSSDHYNDPQFVTDFNVFYRDDFDRLGYKML